MNTTNKKSASTSASQWNRRGLKIVFSLAVAVAIASIASAQTTPPPQKGWTITDLGVVSTISGRASGDTDSSATAINASGTVVGFSGVYITGAEQEGFVGFLNQDGFIGRRIRRTGRPAR